VLEFLHGLRRCFVMVDLFVDFLQRIRIGRSIEQAAGFIGYRPASVFQSTSTVIVTICILPASSLTGMGAFPRTPTPMVYTFTPRPGLLPLRERGYFSAVG